MQIGSIERDPVKCADWAELEVLYGNETAVSLEYIRTSLDVEALLEEEASDNESMPNEMAQSLVAETVREIERRICSGGKGYPFRIHDNRLELKPGVHRRTPYAFCLMLSDRDYYSKSDPAPRLFEYIAAEALKAYLHGKAFRFGAPRDAPVEDIKTAVSQLSKLTGDVLVGTYPIKPTDKDLGLDVFGWKDFTDEKTSKILVYMQCATGDNWQSKRGDLDLSIGGIWSQIVGWTVQPVKAMAIPYVIAPGEEWKRATPGMLVMDRLRISSLLPARALSIPGRDWASWFQRRVDSVASSNQSRPQAA